jgi:hypothetical protein
MGGAIPPDWSNMIITHPIHGNYDAAYSHELDAMLKLGWEIPKDGVQIEGKEEEVIVPAGVKKKEPVKNALVKKTTRRRKNVHSA